MNTRFLVTAAAVLSLSACASLPPGFGGPNPSSADRYSTTQVQQVQRVLVGNVVSVRPVEIKASGTSTAIGGLGGAAAGALVGSQVGSGKGRKAAELLGALAGAFGGGALGSHAGRQQGLEVLVKLAGGQLVSITQAADVQLTVGETVQVLPGGNGVPARVIPLK